MGAMRNRQLNMREVARLAAVSPASVSRALRFPGNVSADIRARVGDAVAQLGYVYNSAAGDVLAGRSTVLGVLVPTASNSLFGETLHGIQDVAMAAGFSIMQGITKYSEDLESRLIEQFLQRRVRGLILTGHTYGQESRFERLAQTAKVRTVVVWEKPKPGSVSYVGFDNRAASMRATRHLIELGHRRIGLIVGPYSRMARAMHRLEGYRDALSAADLAYDPALVMERVPEPLEGKAAMENLLALADPPSAVFAASDLLAFGAMRAVHAAGLSIPRDISIVGFDDMELAAYQEPPLTTVRVDAYMIGRLAAKTVLEPLEAPARHYCIDSDLITRGSTGPAAMVGR